jgi:hypothetical protein
LEACPISRGDVDLTLTRLANASTKVSDNIFAYDSSKSDETNIGRFFSKPVIIFDIERIITPDKIIMFLRAYRIASVDLAYDKKWRVPLGKDVVSEFWPAFPRCPCHDYAL